tara:strand:+ start:10488 stop:10973 length:486 start_codon:yes stop_codon:yes gene_type:complete
MVLGQEKEIRTYLKQHFLTNLMQPYEFLEHTADEKFRAYGKDLEEAFSNAALATTAIMTDVKLIKPKITHTIKVNANNKNTLLYEFLEELIFLVDTEAFLLSKVTSISIKELEGFFKLEATIKGDTADAYEVTTHIKAVTYSEMFIKEEENGVTIQVVHDV